MFKVKNKDTTMTSVTQGHYTEVNDAVLVSLLLADFPTCFSASIWDFEQVYFDYKVYWLQWLL